MLLTCITMGSSENSPAQRLSLYRPTWDQLVDSQTSTLITSSSHSGDILPVDHLLAISEQKKSGLILCKEFHAEFAGPGAIVGSLVEPHYRAVIAIGSPQLIPIKSLKERHRAYGQRIQWGRWLQRIVENPEPTLRAERLLAGFEEFFGRQVVISLPSEVLAMLVGVFPDTIDTVRAQHWHLGRLGNTAFLPSSDQLKVTTITLNRALREATEVPLLTTATISDIQRAYAVLRSA